MEGGKKEGEKENEVGCLNGVEWFSSQESCQAPSSFERCAVGYLRRYGEEREDWDENGFECYSRLTLGRLKLWDEVCFCDDKSGGSDFMIEFGGFDEGGGEDILNQLGRSP